MITKIINRGGNNMSAADTEPNTITSKIISMTEDRSLQIDLLDIMPPSLWHIWMIAAFGALGKYIEPQEYEEFLKRFSSALKQRVANGVW